MKTYQETSIGIPGLHGTDHIGFTVPNLDEVVDFFVNVIGCQAFYSIGPLSADDDYMNRRLDIHPRSIIKGIRLLRCKNGANFEIFEYDAPGQQTRLPRHSDHGGHHIAFYVDDIEAAVTYLKSRGVRILDKPEHKVDGPDKGESWVYFLAPWGMQFELVSYPEGKGYEKDRPERLWHAASPAL